MSAVIRIKRHIDEEPLSAFLLNCKKRKTDTESEEAAGGSSKDVETQILKFSGTLTKAEDISDHILKISKDEAKDLVSKTARTPKITEKNRNEAKSQSQNNRFKIVNCTRGLEQASSSSSTSAATKSLTILDVEKEDSDKKIDAKENNTPSDEDKFVFDVYVPENHYSNNECTSSDNLLNFDDISVVEYVQDFYSYRDASMPDSENDSEDSNDENNWRNDYPDEDDMAGYDDDSSIGENDMRRAMDEFDIDDDRELSSDEDLYGDEDAHDGFVYSIDSDAIGFEDDLDYCDVNRYGEAYARYKRRILKNSDNNYLPKNYCKEDEESDNGSEYSGSD
ncbi:probable RNA polymerase II nuclear localization protein SLC7A6OS [Culicoides brevitarsis]|uniref:probable RNA polymerase II nuclear localization protein SLC7A6OS n=1 Tax=Culicoides brevitarsis TaxID=469753 RepID=UPI00307C479A